MTIDPQITATSLTSAITRVFELASKKIRAIESTWDPSRARLSLPLKANTPHAAGPNGPRVSVRLRLTCLRCHRRSELFELGRRNTIERMAPHITHTGVHDHGFNNLSTYGNLRRLMRNNRICITSGKWTSTKWPSKPVREYRRRVGRKRPELSALSIPLTGRTLCSLTRANTSHSGCRTSAQTRFDGRSRCEDRFPGRLIQHAATTAKFIIYHGDSDEVYDVRGRTAHEAIFNTNNGDFRCRSTQQGYSPFSTWTRGLAWAILGFAEQLEFLKANGDPSEGRWNGILQKAALATADHYIDDCTATDGIPYWDDGAPAWQKCPDWRTKAADPFNDYEPVDSSAAAIAAQGLIRLGRFLGLPGEKYTRAGLTIAKTLFAEPYLSTNSNHQGVLLHSVYHRPNNWDHIPAGRKIPCNESSMWGDYHALELALTIQRIAAGGRYYTFFD